MKMPRNVKDYNLLYVFLNATAQTLTEAIQKMYYHYFGGVEWVGVGGGVGGFMGKVITFLSDL
jgi:hypothetical protein